MICADRLRMLTREVDSRSAKGDPALQPRKGQAHRIAEEADDDEQPPRRRCVEALLALHQQAPETMPAPKMSTSRVMITASDAATRAPSIAPGISDGTITLPHRCAREVRSSATSPAGPEVLTARPSRCSGGSAMTRSMPPPPPR